MVRLNTPRRGPHRTIDLLRNLKDHYKSLVDIRTFGSPDSDLTREGLSGDGLMANLGVLTRTQVADLLRDSDLFIDLSDYQAFGRTGLEAMACGNAVVLPVEGGSGEYARHMHNALLVDTRDENACLESITALIEDKALLGRLKQKGLETSMNYSIQQAVYSELILFLSIPLRKKILS